MRNRRAPIMNPKKLWEQIGSLHAENVKKEVRNADRRKKGAEECCDIIELVCVFDLLFNRSMRFVPGHNKKPGIRA